MKGWTSHSLAIWLSMFGFAMLVRAQTSSNEPPMVTVVATDPSGSEDGPDPATFSVTRTGTTNDPVTVFYSLGGTARNGRDYKMLPGTVTIPAGALSADVTVVPILDVDSSAETNETVILQLHLLVDVPPFGRLTPYALGWPSNAIATIAESSVPPTNRPPLVQLVSPGAGAGFIAPANIQLVAQARDPDDAVASVEFFAGSTSLGLVTNFLTGERYRGLYSLDWTNVPAGDYELTAKATDTKGATNTSAPVTIHLISAADIPVITVAASDPDASELGPDTGTFTLTRTGDTTGPLAVYYSLGGTARNGSDYLRLSGVANFAAGSATTNVTVTPIPDLDADRHTNDTVILQLQRLVDLRPGLGGIYQIGSPSNAVVTITEDDRAFPVVTVEATTPDAAEDGPKPGTFTLTRTGNTNTPLTVLYSLGGTARNGRDYEMLPGYTTFAGGETTTNVTVTPILDFDSTPETNETVVLQLRPSIDFYSERHGAGTGSYGIGFPSNAVVTIAESTAPRTNRPPAVRLVSPGEGTGYVAPATIRLLAQAVDSDGSVSNVQFFAGSTSLGVVTNRLSSGRNRGLFSLNWTNVPVGQYALLAVATDNEGSGSTSGPVHVVVTQTALPSVSIAAADPVALRGTNAMGQTNSARFVVRRTAGTNADLVVYYGISGTASNGVDYARLPGSLTIPAGRYTASISIDPVLDQGQSSNQMQTVMLTLQSPPTTDQNPPTYLLGRPVTAVALIVETPNLRFMPGMVRNGLFHAVVPVSASSNAAGSYRLEVSTDLQNWEAVATDSARLGVVEFVDPDASTPARFYRAVPDSNPEPEQ